MLKWNDGMVLITFVCRLTFLNYVNSKGGCCGTDMPPEVRSVNNTEEEATGVLSRLTGMMSRLSLAMRRATNGNAADGENNNGVAIGASVNGNAPAGHSDVPVFAAPETFIVSAPIHQQEGVEVPRWT